MFIFYQDELLCMWMLSMFPRTVTGELPVVWTHMVSFVLGQSVHPQEQICPAQGRVLCWEASHGAVLMFSSAFLPDGGAQAPPFAKNVSERHPCPSCFRTVQTLRISAVAELGLSDWTGKDGSEDCSRMEDKRQYEQLCSSCKVCLHFIWVRLSKL